MPGAMLCLKYVLFDSHKYPRGSYYGVPSLEKKDTKAQRG